MSAGVICPSDSITTAWQVAPINWSMGTIFFTVPDTLAYTGDETKPPGSPMSCPTPTWSPTATTQLAGLPMCIDSGMVTVAGGGIFTACMPAVFFLCGICTPFRFFSDIPFHLILYKCFCLPWESEPCPARSLRKISY